jgi:hypothetical protein
VAVGKGLNAATKTLRPSPILCRCSIAEADANNPGEIEPAMEVLIRSPVDIVIVLQTGLFLGAGQQIERGSGFELEAAVKIPLSGSVAGFAGNIGAVLTRQDDSTNLQCGPSRRGRTGPTTADR